MWVASVADLVLLTCHLCPLLQGTWQFFALGPPSSWGHA